MIRTLPANAGRFTRVLHQSQMTNYSQFNALTVTGRIVRSAAVDGANGRFLSVELASTATKDGQVVKYTFTNNNGLLSLFDKGHLDKGRQLTVTGHIAEVVAVYTDKKTGETVLMDWPEIKLIGATVLEGGLGAKPASDSAVKPAAKTRVVRRPSQQETPVDETPALTEQPF